MILSRLVLFPVSFPVALCTLAPCSYLREVGFPDNVLEARVARMTAYKNLYGQNQMMEPLSSNRSDSPQSNVSAVKWCSVSSFCCLNTSCDRVIRMTVGTVGLVCKVIAILRLVVHRGNSYNDVCGLA